MTVSNGRQRVRNVLLVTHEPLAPAMAGPAIRVLEIARALAGTVDTTIATPYPITRELPAGITGARYRYGDAASLERAVTGMDAILIQGFTLHKFPFLARLDTPIVVDLYCPFQLENIERLRSSEVPHADAAYAAAVDLEVIRAQLRRGDFFICASERQRDLWLGMLIALGRITPEAYADDPQARRLIDVVPFGLPSDPPVWRAPAFKEVIPGIARDDRLVVWGGSVLEWQDPVTVIDAMALVARRAPAARLALPGGPHPNPQIPPMPVLARARARAQALCLLDRHVFFVPWVPYDRRADYLLEADIGVSAHRETLETRYAWRTRMLDYIWAGLPIVCTSGDVFAELVASRKLGASVPPGNPGAMADAIVGLLEDDERARSCRRALAEVRGELEWTNVVEPLRRFLHDPRRRKVERPPAVLSAGAMDASYSSVLRALGPAVIRRLRRLVGRISPGQPLRP